MENLDEYRVRQLFSKINGVGSDGCWEWTGRVNQVGRPVYTHDIKRKNYRNVTHVNVQTFIYEYYTKEECPARYVDLVCGNKRCCNPDHIKPRTFDTRFWENVYKPYGEDGCWIWQGFKNKRGYGTITIDGKSYSVHRVAYESFYNEEIPDGLMVLHSCNNSSCMNPHHLRLGTHEENMNDMVEAGRAARGEKNGNTVLSEDDARKIKALLRGQTRISKRAIAKAYGVGLSTIKDIASGRTWEWIE